MVELVRDDGCGVGPWKAVIQNIMGGLKVERFLHFGIRRGKQMDQDEAWDEQVDGEVWMDIYVSALRIANAY